RRRPVLRVALWVGLPLIGVLVLLHTIFASRTVTYIELNQATGEQRRRTLLYGIPFRTAVLKEPAYTILIETPWPSVLPDVWAPIRIHRHFGRVRCTKVSGHWANSVILLYWAELLMLEYGVPEEIRADTIELFIRGIPDGVYPLVRVDRTTDVLYADFNVSSRGERDKRTIRIWPD
ncbi:MAG: hypothetical protein EA423_02400, partial [Phycisphaerales bacterium]